jgi:hypothetical protein
MPASAKYAYDVTTGETVMLGRATAPARTTFTADELAKRERNARRMERKRQQRARRREAKAKATVDAESAATRAAETRAAEETRAADNACADDVLLLAALRPAAERARAARAHVATCLRDTCCALLLESQPPTATDAPVARLSYAERLQRATEEWVACLVLWRRVVEAHELAADAKLREVAERLRAMQDRRTNASNNLHAATLAAWEEQLREVCGV